MNKIIRLTEGDLHRIVKRSVNRILKEDFKHGKEADILHQQAMFPSDEAVANEYEEIPWKIKDGLSCLSWLLPNNMEVKRLGMQQRVSKEISDAVQILYYNQDAIIDAVMNTYSQFLDSQGQLSPSRLNKSITNGENSFDRWEADNGRLYHPVDDGRDKAYDRYVSSQEMRSPFGA